jgi:hypothetical protein
LHTHPTPSLPKGPLLGIRKGREISCCIFKKEFMKEDFLKSLESFAKILKTKKKNWKKLK